MGTVVIHTGMSKAGSTTLQEWLSSSAAELRDDHGVHVVVARRVPGSPPGEALEVVPFDRGSPKSTAFLTRYLVAGLGIQPPGERPMHGRQIAAALESSDPDGARRRAIVAELTDGLDRTANDHDTVVLTLEGLGLLLAIHDAVFIRGLEQLTTSHDVRLVSYLRPQHTALEAAWRQWGFTERVEPSQYLGERAEVLHYRQTFDHVRAIAPSIDLRIRPFRRDLLRQHDVVADFALEALDLAVVPTRWLGRWANPGLPLELVNVLRLASAGRAHVDALTDRTTDELKQLAGDWHVPESAEIARSRRILHHWCHERFEVDNRQLAAGMGWPAPGLIPTPTATPPLPPVDLSEIDELWRADRVTDLRALLLLALDAALERQAEPATTALSPPRAR